MYGDSNARISHPVIIPIIAMVGPTKIIKGTGIKVKRKHTSKMNPPITKKGIIEYFTSTAAFNIILSFCHILRKNGNRYNDKTYIIGNK